MPQTISRALAVALIACASAQAQTRPTAFAIRVVDADTGRGVPLVYLRTTFKQAYVTDSDGRVAFDEPGLMDGRDVWFDVKSYGYESPAGAFGTTGVALKPRAGDAAEIKLKRTQIAERLYRLTGYGIYRDTVRLGLKPPFDVPMLNARVTGQDSVQVVEYRSRYRWFWGDTDRLGFALGNFKMSGAVATTRPADVDPDRGVRLDYFVDENGFSRAMADVPRPDPPKPIWLDGLIATRDAAGRERLVGRYMAANADLSTAEAGLVVYVDSRDVFVRYRQFPGDGKNVTTIGGRPFRFREGGVTYVASVEGVRCRDAFEALVDPASYEAFTCVADGKVERDPAGGVVWRWRRGAKPLDATSVDRFVAAGELRPDERAFQLRDVESGRAVKFHNGSIAWSAHAKRWLLLFNEFDGASKLGEVWLASGASPQGPWREARKVATHAMRGNDNDFYNPIQHEELARGRFVYFEGTFVNTFSGNPSPTPLYDYNQLMYRIDLDDPRLKLPEPPAGLTSVEPIP